MKKHLKKLVMYFVLAAMLLSTNTGISFYSVSATDENQITDEEDGYEAGIGFQTDNLTCRDGYSDKRETSDIKYKEWREEQKDPLQDEYNKRNIYYAGKAPEYNTKREIFVDNSEKTTRVCTGAVVQDVQMLQDGEYTISIKNLDVNKGWLSQEERQKELSKAFNMLYIATNIPVNENDDILVKASSVKVAGEEILKDTELPVKRNQTKGSYYQFMIADGAVDSIWDDDAPPYCSSEYQFDEGTTDLLVPEGKFDIDITFSITGVDWEKPSETAEPTKTPLNRVSDKPKVTLPPVKELKAPFDVYLNANVNEALTPSEGEGTRQNVYGSTIMAACFGSEEMKEKVLLAKDEKGKFVFDGSIQDYIIEDSASATITKTGTYTLSVTARGRIDNLVAQGAIWFSVLMDGNVSSTITDFTLIGKSISVQAGNYSETYPWTTEIIKDLAGVNRLTVCNQWDMGNDKEKTNTVTDTIEVLKGDKISFTFYVIGTGDAEPSESPEVTESAKPSESPEVTESTKPSESPQVTESTKPSESPEVMESAKPSESPQVTESAKPNESPEVTESAKPSDNPEVTESTKPSESPEVTESTKPSASPQVTESAKPGNLPTAVPSGNGKQQSNTGNNGKWDGGQDDETSVMYVTQKRDMSEEIGEEEQAEFYRSSNKKVATIKANGILVAKAAGKTTITIGLDDGTVLTYPIVVKIPKIVLSKTKIKLPKNSVSRALRVKKKLSTDKIKSYVVSKKKIVTISKRGAIKGLKRGNTTVTVVMKSGAKASCRVTVR